jgi:hypothetical protein
LPQYVRMLEYGCIVKERTAITEDILTAGSSSSLCNHLTILNNVFTVRQCLRRPIHETATPSNNVPAIIDHDIMQSGLRWLRM